MKFIALERIDLFLYILYLAKKKSWYFWKIWREILGRDVISVSLVGIK